MRLTSVSTEGRVAICCQKRVLRESVGGCCSTQKELSQYFKVLKIETVMVYVSFFLIFILVLCELYKKVIASKIHLCFRSAYDSLCVMLINCVTTTKVTPNDYLQ